MENLTTNRSWFEKPEGKVGGVFLALIIGAGAFGLYQALPFLIILAQNTLHLILLLAAIGAILMIGINPTSRNFIKTAYKQFFKMLTGMVITIDPIAILEDYVDQLRNNLKTMGEQIGKVRGTLHKLKDQIEIYSKEVDQMMREAAIATEKVKSDPVANARFKNVALKNNRKAEMRRSAIAELKKVYQKIEMIMRVLVKMHDNCDVMVDIKADEVNLNKTKWEGIRQANSAMKSAMSIISGSGDERANFELAMEHMADQMALQMGEMEQFMEQSQSFMDSIDLTNATYDEKLFENLEAWEKNVDSFILGEDKASVVNAAYDENDNIDDLKIKLFR